MIVILAFLIIYALSLFGLLYWGFITTFKEANGDFFNSSGFAFPKKWITTYYQYFFSNYGLPVDGGTRSVRLPEMFLNSFLYALGCAFVQTLVPCLTAYVCARFKYKFLNVFYVVVLVTMMIPIVGSTASEIQVASTLGIYDQIWGLWIMKANFLGLYFLIFYETFKGVPETFSEAAKIDGAGNFTIMCRIMLPLIRNTFFTVFLIYFITFWNDYQTPFLYLPNHPTIFYAVYANAMNYGADNLVSNTPGKLALAFIALLPPTILFLCSHKRLLGNITVGGIK